MLAVVGLACGLLFAAELPAAEAKRARRREPLPAVVTNYVLVTNIVIVTNYVVTTNLVLATNGLTSTPKAPPLPDLSWVPPEDGFDWIQLKSGEWLKGKLKALQKRKLEFDSEELEVLTFDWKDIRQLRSPRSNDLLFEDQTELSGPITITPDHVAVAGAAPETRPRAELQSITPSGTKERNYWSGKLAAGLTLRAGNVSQLDYNAQAHLERRTPDTRLALDYVGNVSSVDGQESANNHRLNAEFDYWLDSRLYLITPFGELFTDEFQNVARRLTVGVGVGYDLVYQPKVEWTAYTGPAYQHTWFDSVTPGTAPDSGAAALVFGSHFEWEITRRIDLIVDYRGQYTRSDIGRGAHHGSVTLELDMTKRFELDVSLFWDHTQNPTTDSAGDVPESNDFRLVVGVGARF